MIDDRSLNLEFAREQGIRTIQFQNVAQLRNDLANMGVKLDDEQAPEKRGILRSG
jgi:hypothetical protein